MGGYDTQIDGILLKKIWGFLQKNYFQELNMSVITKNWTIIGI